jgi:hypothetical protein
MLALLISQCSTGKYVNHMWPVSLTTAYNLMLFGIITITNINTALK